MKKLLIIAVSLSILCFTSCIKKKALKYDPDLVGTWVCSDNGVYQWLVVAPDGYAAFRTVDGSDDREVSGSVNYSYFELKMWVGSTKFKVEEWLTEQLDGVGTYDAKDYKTLNKQTYQVDFRMKLRLPLNLKQRVITLYRIKQ